MPPPLNVYGHCAFRVVTTSSHNFVAVRFMSAAARRWSTPEENFLSFQWWRKKVLTVQQLYDEVTGLKEVHDAQNRVIDAEKSFVLAQEDRRKIQSQLSALQKKLKQIYAELDKTPRGEERYVQLVTMEHAVMKEEKLVSEIFYEKEREERDHFSVLSSAVKMGHEKERAQAERTKYWSIIGSVFGTLLGMVASSIMNDIRMKELRNIVSRAVNIDDVNRKDYSELLIENKDKLETLVTTVQKLNDNPVVRTEPVKLVMENHELLIENKNKLEMLVATVQKLSDNPVVYTGPGELVLENHGAGMDDFLAISLVVSAVVISLKLMM